MTQTQQARNARLLPNNVPRWIRVYDNRGETLDRYTVLFTGRYASKTGGEHWGLSMNAAPFHPQGIGCHFGCREIVDSLGGKWPPKIGKRNHLGVRIRFEDLPADCQKAVLGDYRELWGITLE
jgi:hypothetical protein